MYEVLRCSYSSYFICTVMMWEDGLQTFKLVKKTKTCKIITPFPGIKPGPLQFKCRMLPTTLIEIWGGGLKEIRKLPWMCKVTNAQNIGRKKIFPPSADKSEELQSTCGKTYIIISVKYQSLTSHILHIQIEWVQVFTFRKPFYESRCY